MSKLQVDDIVNKDDTGSVGFSRGAVVTGVMTATSFSGALTGNATGLTGSPDITVSSITASGNVSVGGTLTYEDVTNIDSIGIITARSGVSIADSIFHTGDTNTAIRFPAADTFTVETAGSEALRITSDGKVGIGSDAPISPLNILTSDDSVIVLKSTDANAYIAFNDSDSSSTFANRVGTVSNGLYFNTGGGGERLRITSTGGVHFNNAELIERVKITAGKLSENTDIDLDNGMVHYFTTTETSAAVPNITSSVGINTSMATGDTMSVTIVTTAAAAAFAGTFAIDHKQVGVTTFFSGGAPTEGGSSGKDVTALTIVKTGDAAFDVLASITNFE